jgi:hypothetical protein
MRRYASLPRTEFLGMYTPTFDGFRGAQPVLQLKMLAAGERTQMRAAFVIRLFCVLRTLLSTPTGGRD